MTSVAQEVELAQLKAENRELRALVAEYEAAGVVVIVRDETREAACKALWKLPASQARTFLAMCDRPGKVWSKEALLPYASENPDDVELKIVDVRICQIRKALHPKVIVTHWAQGYSVLTPVAAAALRQIELWMAAR